MLEWLFFDLFLLILALVCISNCTDKKRREQNQQTVSHPQPRPRPAYNPSHAVVEPPVHRQWEPSQRQVDVKICTCGKWNASGLTHCWSCNSYLDTVKKTVTIDTAQTCSVCSYWIYPGERVMLCPACYTQGHRAHLFEYVKAKGSCPKCNHRFGPNFLIDTQPVENHSLDLTS